MRLEAQSKAKRKCEFLKSLLMLLEFQSHSSDICIVGAQLGIKVLLKSAMKIKTRQNVVEIELEKVFCCLLCLSLAVYLASLPLLGIAIILWIFILCGHVYVRQRLTGNISICCS